ncbi:MAG: hypothetical protein COA88_00405 [Kordia sp.]|nr:MAG: hypothetical protein COA88_00405 [Kordia sp.]
MGNKKNIDRLFQEQFKDFEATPNDAVWGNIQSKLNERNSNKRRIPVWVMFSCAVATLVFFVGLSMLFLPANESVEAVVVTPENQNSISNDKFVSAGKEEALFVNKSTEKIIDSKLKVNQSNANMGVMYLKTQKDGLSNESFKIKSEVTSAAVKSKLANRGSNEINSNILLLNKSELIQKPSLVQNSSGEMVNGNNKMFASNKYRYDVVKGEGVVAVAEGNTKVVFNEKLNNQDSSRSASGFLSENNAKNNVIEQTNAIKKFTPITSSNIEEREFTGNLKDNSNDIVEDNVVNFSDDTILVKSEMENSLDRISLVEEVVIDEECKEEEVGATVEKTIDEAVAELEEIQKNEDNIDDNEVAFSKWKIAPNIAPVYYNTLSSGSPIDSELSGNKKKGKINMSYGIGVGYAINKKLTIRTGVNKIKLGYNTQDVAIYPFAEAPVDGRGLKNITLTSEASSLNLSGSSGYSISQIPSSYSLLYDSSLNQRLGYIEVPVELSYKISEKKMKINVIAGVSTFFLNENGIYTETNGIETHIGEANNLNKISYSTNIGLGFNYNISKAFNFNFEPTFKYQLNAFSNDSGNFNPYILGVYTGFSFKF